MVSAKFTFHGIAAHAAMAPARGRSALDPLAAVAQKNLQEVGGYKMNADEQKFALDLQKTFKMDTVPSLDTTNEIEPLRKFDPNEPAASTDVGDVSWNVPTIGFSAATFVPGGGAHTWQATATSGMSIGQHGMVVAAKAIALTGLDLLTDPGLVQAAKDDFRKQTAGKSYYTAIPAGQKPPINYRFE
jgi:aminobenzoyl-glutamate utilization protein B